MKKIIIIFTCLILLGCSSNQKTFTYTKIDSKEAKEIISESKNYVILDVRTREEYGNSHIKNAINIPYDEINDPVPINKDNIIFVYCKSGKRSKIATEKLIELGYIAYDLGVYETIDLEE